jgi:hypothetical protein
MQSVTEQPLETMPGYHFTRIIAASLRLDDPVERRRVIESARILLQRGDR